MVAKLWHVVGFNGGGNSSTTSNHGGGGGGGTDIRIGGETWYSRVIVAGGGGGAGTNQSPYYDGTCGGGENSPSQGSHSGAGTQSGATQTRGGQNQSNTPSGFGEARSDGYEGTGGGGGGWFGGAYGYGGGGTGGSGYVLTASSYKPSGYKLGSEYYLTDAQTIAGNQSFPAPGGGTETGHSGNGYARITLVE